MCVCVRVCGLHVLNDDALVFVAAFVTLRQGEGVAITEAGFQFLLMDMQAQLWVLLKQYVHLAEDDAGEPQEVHSSHRHR